MKENILRILDSSLLYSLWVFLVSFLLTLVFVAYRLRARRGGLADYFQAEFYDRYQEDFVETDPPELLLSYRPRMAIQALLVSAGLSALCFVVLAFTPITFFDNFANRDLSSAVPLQLTRMSHDRTSQGFSLTGEVWNRSQQPIGDLHAVVEIWKSDRETLDEVSIPVIPNPLDSGSAGTFNLSYFKNSPFLHGYRIRFESGSTPLSHLKGFDSE